jgi:hypothetical protein
MRHTTRACGPTVQMHGTMHRYASGTIPAKISVPNFGMFDPDLSSDFVNPDPVERSHCLCSFGLTWAVIAQESCGTRVRQRRQQRPFLHPPIHKPIPYRPCRLPQGVCVCTCFLCGVRGRLDLSLAMHGMLCSDASGLEAANVLLWLVGWLARRRGNIANLL